MLPVYSEGELFYENELPCSKKYSQKSPAVYWGSGSIHCTFKI